MESLGIATLPIPNDKARHEQCIKTVLDDWLKKRSGALDLQIKRKNRKIWAKIVVCKMTLIEIENLVTNKFSVDLCLIDEAKRIVGMAICPRNIKNELKRALCEQLLS